MKLFNPANKRLQKEDEKAVKIEGERLPFPTPWNCGFTSTMKPAIINTKTSPYNIPVNNPFDGFLSVLPNISFAQKHNIPNRTIKDKGAFIPTDIANIIRGSTTLQKVVCS